MKFLIDENLSPQLAKYLSNLGYTAIAIRDVGLKGATDTQIAIWAREEKAVIVTKDLDFGLLYQQVSRCRILILRGHDDNTSTSQTILKRLHKGGVLKLTTLNQQLTVATETRVRFFPKKSSN